MTPTMTAWPSTTDLCWPSPHLELFCLFGVETLDRSHWESTFSLS